MWSDNHIHRLSEGIDRRMALNNPEYPPGALWDLLNMVYTRDAEEPEKMRGTSRIGSTNLGGGVSGLVDYDEGTRLIACAVDGKVYERASGDFSQSTNGTGFNTTATTRWSGGMFYGATTSANLLIISNGIDTPKKYTSGAGVSALSGSPPSTGKFGVSFLGRWWLAAGDTLSYSVVNDAEDWTTGNGGGSIQIDRGSGDITGLHVFAGNLLIFKRRKVYRILPVSTISQTSVRELSSGIGCVSHHTIAEGKDSTLYFQSDNGVAGAVPTNATGGFYVSNISGRVKPILDRRDMSNQATSWGIYNEDRGEYYLQYSTSGVAPTRGIIANDARGRRQLRWTRHDHSGLTAGTVYRSSGQELQVVGNSAGQIFQMHSGDDRNDLAYSGRLITPGYGQGAPNRMKKYGPVWVNFLTNGTYDLTVRLNLGRFKMPTPAGTQTSVEGGSADGWGEGAYGVALWGGQVSRGRYARPFKVSRGTHLQVIVETTGVDQWFQVNGLVMQYALRGNTIAA